MIRAFGISCLALAASVAPAFAGETALPIERTQAVHLSNPAQADTLTLMATGETCETSRVWVAVETAFMRTVYTQSHALRELSIDGTDCTTLNDVLDNFVRSMPAADLPATDRLTERQGYHNVDAEAVAEARLEAQPVLCFKAGKSSSNCYALVNGRTVQLFSSGS